MKINTVNKPKLIILFIFLTYVINIFSQDEIVYKQVDTVKLKLFVYKPLDFRETEKYPTIVFFFGGGWRRESINQFKVFAEHYAAKGLIAVLADYRVKNKHGTTPFEALKDAKSAIRFLRENASNIGVDPANIIASGGSAGGHLAAACYTNKSINEENESAGISAKPNALVLFNPVIDNSEQGYGYERIGEKYLEFSPLHNIKEGFPPTIFFLGTKDKLIPVETAELFKEKIESVGSRCELFLYEEQAHGFFNQKKFHKDILFKVDNFLSSLGYLK